MAAPATQYSIRLFLPGDASLYRAMRLEALKNEPGVYGANYAEEAALPESAWTEKINDPRRACFGLYADDELIGITGVIIDKDDTGKGHMIQSYIRKAYRELGLSAILYKARIAWAQGRKLTGLAVGHKESNLASKAANQHFAFMYSHSEARTWPDGSTEEILYYELVL